MNTINQTLSEAAAQFGRFGNAQGVTDFGTEEEAEGFRDCLSLRYPVEGYGTLSSKPEQLQSGAYRVEWRVYSCE